MVNKREIKREYKRFFRVNLHTRPNIKNKDTIKVTTQVNKHGKNTSFSDNKLNWVKDHVPNTEIHLNSLSNICGNTQWVIPETPQTIHNHLGKPLQNYTQLTPHKLLQGQQDRALNAKTITTKKTDNCSRPSTTILHQNVQSLKNKVQSLEVILNELNPISCLCICEHWCDETELLSVVFENFRLASYFCRLWHKCGGACIFIHDSIQFKRRNDLELLSDELNFEVAAIELTDTNNVPLIIVCIYRSPSGKIDVFFGKIEQLFFKIVCVRCKIVLCGDFNIDLYDTESKTTSTYLNILYAYGLHPLTNFATRETNTSSTCIDHFIISKNVDKANLSKVINGLSDHHAQLLSTHCSKIICETTQMYKRDFKNLNIFYQDIQHENWAPVFSAKSVNDKFRSFMNIFSLKFNMHFPKKLHIIKHGKSKQNWITNGIRVSSNKLKILYEISKLNNSPNFVNYYRKYKKVYRRVLKQAKKLSNDLLIQNSQNKSKTVWNIIKTESGSKRPSHQNLQLIHQNGTVINSAIDTANYINEYFCNIARQICAQITQHNIYQRKSNSAAASLYLYPVSLIEMTNCIKKLKSKNSTGLDDIPVKIIKDCSPVLLKPLIHIINESFLTGVFPDDLKIAKVIPLFKKGNKHVIENYRPISLLSSVSKIFELILKNRITDFVTKFKLLNNFQHGFLKGRSTESAIGEFMENILTCNEESYSSLGIFLDLSKAFDTVDHKILLEKLENIGIRGIANNLLKSYLTNRRQVVELIQKNEQNFVNTYHSQSNIINVGVPQGSILGPLLFIIYLNDLKLQMSNVSIVSFADDTNLIIKPSMNMSLENSAISALHKITSWFAANNLALNLDKTKYILFNSNSTNREPELFVQNKQISSVQQIRFLGVEIDNKLSWDEHTKHIVKKLNSSCYMLKALASVTSHKCLRSVYFAYVHSHISYGIVFWGIYKKNLQSVFTVQKRALRMIQNMPPLASCRNVFSVLGILPVPCVYIYKTVLYINKNKNKYCTNTQVHHYNTRNKSNFHIKSVNKAYSLKTVNNVGIRFYNKLPDNIKNITDSKNFKKQLFDFLLRNSFYSVSEYLTTT